jgi:hypothetical protein
LTPFKDLSEYTLEGNACDPDYLLYKVAYLRVWTLRKNLSLKWQIWKDVKTTLSGGGSPIRNCLPNRSFNPSTAAVAPAVCLLPLIFFLNFTIYLQSVEIHSANDVLGNEGG